MFFQIEDKIRDYHPKADVDLLEKAYVFIARVKKKYAKSERNLNNLGTGKAVDFIAHNLSVASLLADMKLDEETITAGILHDFPEKYNLEEPKAIEATSKIFPATIVEMLEGLAKLAKLTYTRHEESQAEYFRKMILAVSKDIRVILVKLADRLDGIRRLLQLCQDDKGNTIKSSQSWHDYAENIARETLNVYAPLAARLGIEWIKKELENASFRLQKPEVYNEIIQKLAKTEEERKHYIEKVKSLLEQTLAEYDIEAQVLGRPKHIYSIYKKMIAQKIDINKVYDLIAFRIIVKTTADCYEVLSLIQSLWDQVPGRYKDFIERPKQNGYQSIHVTVIGPYGEPMEIQIRTEEMDKIANEGIAAHWLYKENEKFDPGKVSEIARYSILRQMVEWNNNPEKLRETFKELIHLDLFPNEVYVFTPQGDIKVLPKGATPVDFAYHIHTELGNRCIGARVNGKMVPLKYEIQNGDVLEIITSKKQRPSQDWLSFVKTSKAKSRIKQWLKAAAYEEALALGKELCEKEFKKKALSFSDYFSSPKMMELARTFSLRSVDDLIASVGFKKITPLQILGRLIPEIKDRKGQKHPSFASQELPELPEDLKKDGSTDRTEEKSSIKMFRSGDVLSRFAQCCNPLPGEPIIGYITRGRGVTIHRKNCRNVKEVEKNRLIAVEWDPLLYKPHQGSRYYSTSSNYIAPLRIIFSNKKGTLANISAILGQMDAEMTEVHVKTLPDGTHEGLIKIAVKDVEHLKKIIITLKSEQYVYHVERVGTAVLKKEPY